MANHTITEKDIEDGIREIEELRRELVAEEQRLKIMDEVLAHKKHIIAETEAKLAENEKKNQQLRKIAAAVTKSSQAANDVQVDSFTKLLSQQLKHKHQKATARSEKWIERTAELNEIHGQFQERMRKAEWLQEIAQAEQNLKNAETERDQLIEKHDLLKKQEGELISRVKTTGNLKQNKFILTAVQLAKQNSVEQKRLAEVLVVKNKLVAAAQRNESVSVDDSVEDLPAEAQETYCTPPNVNRVAGAGENARHHVRLNDNPDVHLITPESRSNTRRDYDDALSPPSPNLMASPVNDESLVMNKTVDNHEHHSVESPELVPLDSNAEAVTEGEPGSILGSFVFTSNTSGVAFPLGEEDGHGVGFNFGNEKQSDGMMDFRLSLSPPKRKNKNGDGSSHVAGSSDSGFMFDFGAEDPGFELNLSVDEDKEGGSKNFFGF